MHSTTASTGAGARSLAALPVPGLPAQRDSFFIFFSLLLSFLGHVPCPSPASSLASWQRLPQAPVPSLISCCQEGKRDCSFN